MSEEPNLFNQPEPAAIEAVLGGEQRARARDLRRKKKRLGPSGLPPTIQERFEEFHEENPNVFRELVAIAIEAKQSGQYEGGWSISGAYEVARYRSIKTTGSRSSSRTTSIEILSEDHGRDPRARRLLPAPRDRHDLT